MIPQCRGVSNDLICKLLCSNPSLLNVDISNKQDPFIDQAVVSSIAHSCRYLTVLKLSDYYLEDPSDLLVLCGKALVYPKSRQSPVVSCRRSASSRERSPLNSNSANEWAVESGELMERVTNMLVWEKNGSGESEGGHEEASFSVGVCAAACGRDVRQRSQDCETMQGNGEESMVFSVNMENAVEDGDDDSGGGSGVEKSKTEARERCLSTQEEERNRQGQNAAASRSRSRSNSGGSSSRRRNSSGSGRSRDGSKADNSSSSSSDSEAVTDADNNEDCYGDDSFAMPLEVEDRSDQFGCLELDTLWLENINLTDQVAAVLLQSLQHLRDLNLSGTEISNPWRLAGGSDCAHHLKHLQELDVTSTSLSRSAMLMITECHPDLWKLSISSTTLPPQTYRNIAKLSGIANLELIGGQFYPREPEEIFTSGILPAVVGVGRHLESLSLAFFAHVELTKVASSCPTIRQLDLSHTEIFVTTPCRSIVEHCPNLVSLSLSHARIEVRDPYTSRILPDDAALQQVLGEPKPFEELNLSGLGMSTEGIKELFCSAKYQLKTLKVSSCKALTISGVRHLWKVCPILTYIDIAHCKNITLLEGKTFEENCVESRPDFKLGGKIRWK